MGDGRRRQTTKIEYHNGTEWVDAKVTGVQRNQKNRITAYQIAYEENGAPGDKDCGPDYRRATLRAQAEFCASEMGRLIARGDGDDMQRAYATNPARAKQAKADYASTVGVIYQPDDGKHTITGFHTIILFLKDYLKADRTSTPLGQEVGDSASDYQFVDDFVSRLALLLTQVQRGKNSTTVATQIANVLTAEGVGLPAAATVQGGGGPHSMVGGTVTEELRAEGQRLVEQLRAREGSS